MRTLIVFFYLLLMTAIPANAAEPSVLTTPETIHQTSQTPSDDIAETPVVLSTTARQTTDTGETRIALLSSPKTIGKYTQSVYNVSLATLSSRLAGHYELKRYDLNDESVESIRQTLDTVRRDGMNAIIAPLTSNGVKNLLQTSPAQTIFIPTVHKRDFPYAPENITFGAIDYQRQIEALLPFMSASIAIFYDGSSVGKQLKNDTEEIFLANKHNSKGIASYPVDAKGDNIVTHLSSPSRFNKKSIFIHIPVVKSSVLAAHLTFVGANEHNILSTQINVDPTLLTLTQYNDRKNMILANSLVEFPPSIYQANEAMNNDIVYDWVNYTSTVGIDFLVSRLTKTPREYSLRINNAQVVYPIELLRPTEDGFEPLK